MSLSCVSASSQYAEINSALVSAAPFTFACWLKLATVGGAGQTAFALATSGSGDNHFKNEIAVAGIGRFRARTTGSTDALTTGVISTGVWTFFACRATSATSRTVQLGTERVNSTTSRVPTGMNRTSIGRSAESSGTSYLNGLIAYPTLWDVSLSNTDLDSLQAQTDPRTIQASDRVAFWPFASTPTLGEDDVSSNDLTISGATYSSDEPFVLPGGGPVLNSNFLMFM